MKTKPSSNIPKRKRVGSKHPDSNSLLSSIIESPVNIVIFSLDRNYYYTAFNNNHKQTIKNIWGADIEIGMNMLEIIKDPKDRKKAKKNFDRALKGKSFTLIEEYGEPPNRFYYEDVYSPVFDDSGNITGLSLFLTDITEKKRTEDELNKYRNHLEDLVKQRTRELETTKKKLELDITKYKKAKEEIKESTERFNAFFEQSPYSIQILSPDGFTKYVNPAWEKLWGVTIDALKDYNMLEDEQLVEKEIMPFVLKGFAGEVTEVPAIEYNPEETKVIQEGTKRYVSSKFFPISFEEGKIHEIVVVHEDITERKQAYEEITYLKEFNDSILNGMAEGVVVQDAEGIIKYVNAATRPILGYTEEDLLGKHWSQIIPKDQHTAVVAEDKRRLKGESSIYDMQLARKDGQLIDVMVSGSPRFKDGEFIGTMAVFTDITEQKMAVGEVRESEEKYRTLVETSPDAVTVTDLEGNLSFVSKRTLEIHGYLKKGELLGKSAFELIAPEDHEKATTNLKKTLEKGFIRDQEYTLLKKDGAHFKGEISASLINDVSGTPTGFIATTKDITERKQIEEEREKLIIQLQEAFDKIDTMSGLIPICAWCKKVRDDQGYWNEVEAYVEAHSKAEFSHGICPNCVKKHLNLK